MYVTSMYWCPANRNGIIQRMNKDRRYCLPNLWRYKGATLAGTKISTIILGLTVHWVEYILPSYATKWRLRCLDCILIEAQNDIYFIQTTGSLKAIRLDCNIFSETHSGWMCRWKLVCTLQFARPLWTSYQLTCGSWAAWVLEHWATGTILHDSGKTNGRTLNSVLLICVWHYHVSWPRSSADQWK